MIIIIPCVVSYKKKIVKYNKLFQVWKSENTIDQNERRSCRSGNAGRSFQFSSWPFTTAYSHSTALRPSHTCVHTLCESTRRDVMRKQGRQGGDHLPARTLTNVPWDTDAPSGSNSSVNLPLFHARETATATDRARNRRYLRSLPDSSRFQVKRREQFCLRYWCASSFIRPLITFPFYSSKLHRVTRSDAIPRWFP